MQRLFSMFPGGAAGVALLVLRVGVLGSLLTGLHVPMDFAAPSLKNVFLLALAVMLFLGLLTPVSCALVLITQAVSIGLASSSGVLDIAINMLVTASLLLLGPGAYSVDARNFGRRRILPSHRHD